MRRNTFRPWEVELLLDIEGCSLRESAKRETLKRYQKAVQRQMEKGARLPLKLSEYLENVKPRRRRKPRLKRLRRCRKPVSPTVVGPVPGVQCDPRATPGRAQTR